VSPAVDDDRSQRLGQCNPYQLSHSIKSPKKGKQKRPGSTRGTPGDGEGDETGRARGRSTIHSFLSQ